MLSYNIPNFTWLEISFDNNQINISIPSLTLQIQTENYNTKKKFTEIIVKYSRGDLEMWLPLRTEVDYNGVLKRLAA